jgi:hypothetical protein
MLAPAAIKYLDSSFLYQFSHLLLDSFILSVPPHHQEVDAIYGECAVIILPNHLWDCIEHALYTLVPVLIDGADPSEVVVRVWHHVDHIMIEATLGTRFLLVVLLTQWGHYM